MMWRAFWAACQRDMLLSFRRSADLFSTLFFFLLVTSLFPLGVGADQDLLRQMAPGILWVAALLSASLSLSRLFAGDHADGTLEQYLLSSAPLALVVLGKAMAHWLTSLVPLIALSPLLALQFDLPAGAIGVLVLSLVLGSPCLSLIGAIGAALTLGVRGGGVLLSLLILPLYIPVLIFGSTAVSAQLDGLDTSAHMHLLGGLSLGALSMAPWAAAAALRMSAD